MDIELEDSVHVQAKQERAAKVKGAKKAEGPKQTATEEVGFMKFSIRFNRHISRFFDSISKSNQEYIEFNLVFTEQNMMMCFHHIGSHYFVKVNVCHELLESNLANAEGFHVSSFFDFQSFRNIFSMLNPTEQVEMSIEFNTQGDVWLTMEQIGNTDCSEKILAKINSSSKNLTLMTGDVNASIFGGKFAGPVTERDILQKIEFDDAEILKKIIEISTSTKHNFMIMNMRNLKEQKMFKILSRVEINNPDREETTFTLEMNRSRFKAEYPEKVNDENFIYTTPMMLIASKFMDKDQRVSLTFHKQDYVIFQLRSINIDIDVILPSVDPTNFNVAMLDNRSDHEQSEDDDDRPGHPAVKKLMKCEDEDDD